MMKHFLIPMIATAGLIVVAADARARFFAPRGPLRAIEVEEGRGEATGT